MRLSLQLASPASCSTNGGLSAIALLFWSIRFAMQLFVFHQTGKSLEERKFRALLPFFDVLQPLWNASLKLQKSMRRKDEFMRK